MLISAGHLLVKEKGKLVMARLIKQTSLLFVIAIIIGIFTLALTSCSGGIAGLYSSINSNSSGATFNGEIVTSIEFKSSGKAEIKTESLLSETTYVDASFKINGNEIVLNAKWNYTDKWEGTYTYSQAGDTISIDGYIYMKPNEDILKGNFKSIAGNYANAKGSSFSLKNDGIIVFNNGYGGEGPRGLPTFSRGRYFWGSGEGIGSVGITVYPIGIEVEGSIITDTSRIRLHIGHSAPSSNEEVYYKN